MHTQADTGYATFKFVAGTNRQITICPNLQYRGGLFGGEGIKFVVL